MAGFYNFFVKRIFGFLFNMTTFAEFIEQTSCCALTPEQENTTISLTE